MLRDLLEALQQGTLWDPVEREIARGLLSEPWCWPCHDPWLAAALSLRDGPNQVNPGEVCLLAVNQGRTAGPQETSPQEEGGVWKLIPTDSSTAGSPPTRFTGEAERCLQQAFWLAARDLPALQRPHLFEKSLRWGALPLHPREQDWLLLDGPSFGLAMCLGVVSLLLHLPVSPKLCATATISPTGALGPVEGLLPKLRALRDHAPGIRTLLVSEDQKPEAEKLIRELGLVDLEVSGFRVLADAIGAVFPEQQVSDGLLDAWKDAAVARHAAQEWFRTALESSPRVLSWGAFASTADKLLTRLGDEVDPELRCKVWLARQIGRRHDGQHAPIPWCTGEQPLRGDLVLADSFLKMLRRPVRLDVLAHIVQASADADLEVEEVIPRALQHVAERQERGPGDLKLLGACGRALASVASYQEAAAILKEAVEDWFAIEQGLLSTHALSEYLRLLGLLHQADELEQAVADYLHWLNVDPRLDHRAISYVRLSAARALTQNGKHREASQWLDDVPFPWEQVPKDVQAARLRWLARAFSGLGEPARAASCRKQLERTANSKQQIQWLLSLLDEALESKDGARIDEAMNRLTIFEKDNPTWSIHINRWKGSARRLAEEFRY